MDTSENLDFPHESHGKSPFVHRSAIPEGRPTAETGKISTIIE